MRSRGILSCHHALENLFITRPINEIYPSSIRQDFASALSKWFSSELTVADGAVELVCGPNNEERYLCEYPSYDNCADENPNVFAVCSSLLRSFRCGIDCCSAARLSIQCRR